MDVGLSKDQQMIVETVRSVVESGVCPPEDQSHKTAIPPLALRAFFRQASDTRVRTILRIPPGSLKARVPAQKELQKRVASVVRYVADIATRPREVALNPVLVQPKDDDVLLVHASIRIEVLTVLPTRSCPDRTCIPAATTICRMRAPLRTRAAFTKGKQPLQANA